MTKLTLKTQFIVGSNKLKGEGGEKAQMNIQGNNRMF
jgi:hypothetical protein